MNYKYGEEALTSIGLDPSEAYYAPYIIVLDADGHYAGTMQSTDAIKGFEIRESGGEEFRGYDRKILLEQLKVLKAKATD